jgi:molybdopterin-guanine dinucleotide biosynthesis protein A
MANHDWRVVTGGGTSARVAGYVLGGGGSTRFGRDKALAQIDGKLMLIRMRELLDGVTTGVRVVAATGKYASLEADLVTDRWPGEGPLGGIITALLATAETRGGREWNLILSCDMPFLTREWLVYLVERALASSAGVVASKSEHGLEPLCACWRTSAAGKLQRDFEGGVRKITDAMKHLEMEVLDETHWKRFDSAGRLFWNMNTPADYEEAKRILEADSA